MCVLMEESLAGCSKPLAVVYTRSGSFSAGIYNTSALSDGQTRILKVTQSHS